MTFQSLKGKINVPEIAYCDNDDSMPSFHFQQQNTQTETGWLSEFAYSRRRIWQTLTEGASYKWAYLLTYLQIKQNETNFDICDDLRALLLLSSDENIMACSFWASCRHMFISLSQK